MIYIHVSSNNTECPTTYHTRQFLNNSKTNEYIATRFEQEYVRRWEMKRNVSVVRFKFRCNILISGKIIKELPGLVGSGTSCIGHPVTKIFTTLHPNILHFTTLVDTSLPLI
jgi:hypothetical protein